MARGSVAPHRPVCPATPCSPSTLTPWTIGPPSPSPDRENGPFEELLGPKNDIDGRPLAEGSTDCGTTYDQTRSTAQPDDQTDILWHQPQHPDLWLYPFNPPRG